MKRLIEIQLAHVSCWWYLLTRGMWRGERKVVMRLKTGELLIMACKGADPTRTFFDDPWFREQGVKLP